MMGRWLAPVVILVLLFSTGAALAGDRGLVCRVPTVVDEMTREIRDHNYYSRFDPAFVTESPTADPNIVRCHVCVLSALYDTRRFRNQPIRPCLPHGFEVLILSGGFVVRDLE
jgi:hypothetical protein